jgi:5-formyltetrahydrofolate cyclo-ligase
MLKHELRTLYKAKRQALSHRDALSQQIAQVFFEHFPWETYQNFHIFLPMLKMHEIDTKYIYQKLWGAQKQVFCPVVNGQKMLSVPFKSHDDCQMSDWGIPEPNGQAQNPHFSVVFLPLLCADTSGNRLGYGKGFYDDFLATLDPKTLKIGLSFFAPIPYSIDDLRPEDMPLDYLICPDGMLSFGAKSMK